jgi:Undecaprenyl-phosphate galactose phosphotransferase WbaP
LLLPLPRIMKRSFDIVACLVGGVVILPLLLLIAIAIRITSPGPVIFRQRRIGQNGRYFMACKFRTMVIDANRVLEEKLKSNPAYRREWEADHKLKDDPRVTPIGRWLRKTSLDELPQIWNTLKGEMSLVGPRPIVDAEIVKYGRDFELYTSVLPGISGLWQVSGRNDTTYQQRVDLDSYYVRNWSPWMDIYILSKTVSVIVSRRGAY